MHQVTSMNKYEVLTSIAKRAPLPMEIENPLKHSSFVNNYVG